MWECGQGKKRIMRSEKDGSLLHISIYGQHNEIYQTLFEKG
jgi:hypothetical protein